MQNNVRTIAPSHNQIRTEVVTTYQQLLHAYAIRSICFMEEHGVKAQQELRRQRLPGHPHDRLCRRRAGRHPAHPMVQGLRQARTHGLPRGLSQYPRAEGFRVFRVRPHRPQRIRQGHHPRPAEICAACGESSSDSRMPKARHRSTSTVTRSRTSSWSRNSLLRRTQSRASTDTAVMFRTEGFWDAPSEFEAAA